MLSPSYHRIHYHLHPATAWHISAATYLFTVVISTFTLTYSNHTYLTLSFTAASTATGVATLAARKSFSNLIDTRTSPEFLALADPFSLAAGTDEERAEAAFNKDLALAVVVFNDNENVQTLIQPAEASPQQYIANASSYTDGTTSKLRPIKFGPSAFGIHLQVIANTEYKKFPAFPKGKAFTKRDLPCFKDVLDGSISKKYVLVAVPNSILLPFGSPSTYSGAFDDVAAALISDNHPNFGFVMELIEHYDSDIGTTINDNLTDVTPFLPKTPEGSTIHTDPFTIADPLSNAEEEGSLAEAVESLRLRINRFNQQAPPPATPANNPVQPVHPVQPLPTTVSATTPSAPSAATPKDISNDQIEAEEILARFRLLGARLAYDANGQPSGLILGTVHPELESLIRRSTKGKRPRNFMAYLKTKQKSVEDSFDYLLRYVHWSAMGDLAVVAWVLGMTGSLTELTSIEEAQHQAEGLTSFQFTVDTRKQEKERQRTSHLAMANRHTEDLMGMTDSDVHRTKVSTTSYANTNIANIEALLACGANHVFLPYALCDFTLRGDDCPTFVTAIKSILDASSTAAFRRKMEYHPQRAKFCYYVFVQFQAILQKILTFAVDPLFTQYAQDVATHALIPIAELEEIEALTDIVTSDIKMFTLGSRGISTTPLYESSIQFKSEYKRLHSQMGYTSTPTSNEPPTKRLAGADRTPRIPTTPKTPHTPSTNQASKAGLIIYAQRHRMPVPKITNPSKVPNLCIMHLRDGLHCPYGDTCRNSHAPYDSWPKSLQEDICKFVDSDVHLSFNPKVAPSSLTSSS